ncbi:MAG: DUF554 domain-containing protein [Tannerella sp.]|nr:DUF554 domain-containing protein [Tannerella sp.]
MIGTLVNAAAIVTGSSIGIIFKKSLPERYQTIYFEAVGLFTLLLGIKMSLEISSYLPVVLSMVLGGFIGMRLRLEHRTEQLGDFIKIKIRTKNERFTEGLVSSFLLFCMGSMTVVGSIEEGLGKSPDLLLTKSIMDFFSAIMLASGWGVGVLFSAIPVLLFQGGITLAAAIIGKDIPESVVNELSVVGGLILVGLSFHLMKIKKIEVINFLPALALICLFMWLKIRFADSLAFFFF